MLADYQNLLNHLRRDPARWPQLAHQPLPDAEKGWEAAYRARLGVLVCLQYDLQPSDEALVRYLFQEEIRAREEQSPGLSEALELGAFLLASFRRPGDLRLFWRAKMANFDTFLGLDTEYLVWLDAGGALDRLLHEELEPESPLWEPESPLWEMVRFPPTERDLAAWWADMQKAFPRSEDEEDPERLLKRAVALQAMEPARRWLDVFEAQTSPSPAVLSTIRYYRDLLG
jgi:hypothetical protein